MPKTISKHFEYHDECSERTLVFDDSRYLDYQGLDITISDKKENVAEVSIDDKDVLKSIISNLQYIYDNWTDRRGKYDKELDDYHKQVSLNKSLYQGLLDKACEWLKDANEGIKFLQSIGRKAEGVDVEKFRKEMEYECTESKNDTKG